MAMMSCVGKLAVVLPVATDRAGYNIFLATKP